MADFVGVSEALDELVRGVRRSVVQVQRSRRGAGAGIIWRPNGVIVTNNHVIGRSRLKVVLDDGRELPARVVGRDPEVDMAVLRVDAGGLPALPISDSRAVRVGALVLAIGHPWGERSVATAGIVSNVGSARTRGLRGSVDIIRSDVRLAPGNSGGPLVDAAGAVLGVNSMIVGGDQGVAIAAHEADALVAEALDRDVMLGVGVQPVDLPAIMQDYIGREQTTGLLVAEVVPGGPADNAGITIGDILVELDGAGLTDPRALVSALLLRRAGDLATVGVVRGGRWREIAVELATLEKAA